MLFESILPTIKLSELESILSKLDFFFSSTQLDTPSSWNLIISSFLFKMRDMQPFFNLNT